MKIQIGTLVLGQGDYFLETPIEGLGVPTIRTSGDDFSGTDGGYVSQQNYSRRTIALTGSYVGCNFALNLPIRVLYPITITNGSTVRFTEGYITYINADIVTPRVRQFQITIVCPDAYLYEQDIYLEQTFNKVIGGGFILPVVLPIVFAAGSTPAVITNTSDITVYPQIVLEGQFTNPKIINQTTGQFVQLSVTTTSGDEIIIDNKNRTITLNGGSILNSRSLDSTWFGLQKGGNKITLETSSGSDESTGTMRWRTAYEGI